MEKTDIASFGFDHNGKHYEIKVFQIGNKYIVVPYLNGEWQVIIHILLRWIT